PAVSLIPPESSLWMHIPELVLPIVVLVLVSLPNLARVSRASIIEILESDYIEMARLKGLNSRRILWLHALPNAVGPSLQVAALNLAHLAGGIVIIEAIFNYPGIGSAMVDPVSVRD